MAVLTEELLRVIEQAVHSTSEGITIADVSQSDMPLIYANPAFYQVTGYTPEETIGFNCRFLQGPDTDRAAVKRMRNALNTGESCIVELLNYRKDGTPFWNRLSIVPIHDSAGTVTHFVGIQSDVTIAKEVDRARAQLAAMRATMQTVNDVVRNFMSNIEYFRFQIESSANEDPDMLAEYEAVTNATLDKLTTLSSAHTYREREVLRGIVGIDMERITRPGDEAGPSAT